MQISELATRSGVTLTSVKFYLREGMLAPGSAVHARRADYGEEHLERLLLIRALTSVAGLPLSRTKRVLEVLDAPEGSLVEVLAEAIAATADDRDDVTVEGDDLATAYPRAFAATQMLGPAFRPRLPALAQLERAIDAAAGAGFEIGETSLRRYAPHVEAIAQAELESMPLDHREAVRYSVLGTTLYEPVLAALRRLAHQNIVASLPRDAPPAS